MHNNTWESLFINIRYNNVKILVQSRGRSKMGRQGPKYIRATYSSMKAPYARKIKPANLRDEFASNHFRTNSGVFTTITTSLARALINSPFIRGKLPHRLSFREQREWQVHVESWRCYVMRETGISCSVNVEIACGGHVTYNTNRVSRYLHSTCNLVKLSKFRGRHVLILRVASLV